MQAREEKEKIPSARKKGHSYGGDVAYPQPIS